MSRLRFCRTVKSKFHWGCGLFLPGSAFGELQSTELDNFYSFNPVFREAFEGYCEVYRLPFRSRYQTLRLQLSAKWWHRNIYSESQEPHPVHKRRRIESTRRRYLSQQRGYAEASAALSAKSLRKFTLSFVQVHVFEASRTVQLTDQPAAAPLSQPLWLAK